MDIGYHISSSVCAYTVSRMSYMVTRLPAVLLHSHKLKWKARKKAKSGMAAARLVKMQSTAFLPSLGSDGQTADSRTLTPNIKFPILRSPTC